MKVARTCASIVLACALSFAVAVPVTLSAQELPQAGAGKLLKQKIAVGRFTNETRYGKSLLRDHDLDPLGKQAADILATYLTESGKFLVFERPDLSKIVREQGVSGGGGVVGVDTLIVGSVVEFGTKVDGQRGFFNKRKTELARAAVALRLVDVDTGLVFHSATGTGEASTEIHKILGMGSSSRFNGTLQDRALALAIEDVIEELVNTIAARPWKTDILQVRGDRVFIAGGRHQGVGVGDYLAVMRAGDVVKSGQSGLDISLPAEKIADLEVVELFGESELNEGAIALLVSGKLAEGRPAGLFVTAAR